MDRLSKSILESVLGIPTASFHEEAVAAFVKRYARGLGAEVEGDRFGNVLVRYRRRKGRGITFAAHMDHPGFEVISSRGRTSTVAMWGRIEEAIFLSASVVIHTADDMARGKIGPKRSSRDHLGRPCFSLTSDREFAIGDFGHFDLPAVKFSGDRIAARAADDLVGVALILDLMARIGASRSNLNVSGLFTRAEEAGFIGALAAIESGLVPRQDPVVVMECSKAERGKTPVGRGAVIRAGDRVFTFDPNVDIWIANVARALKTKSKGVEYQREIMQGGRCEAAIYLNAGFVAGALALPLGNYHNHGPNGPVAEYVSAKDYRSMLCLMMALVRSPMPKDALGRELKPVIERYRERRKKLLNS